MQREEKVGGHAVAMRLHVHGDTRVRSQPAPAFDVRDALGQAIGPHVGLQVDVIGAEFAHQRQRRLQVLDAARIALRLPLHAVRAQEAGHLARVVGFDEADAGAVEPGVADHRQPLGQRPLHAIRPTPLHRPH
jgi:hypothetical protein